MHTDPARELPQGAPSDGNSSEPRLIKKYKNRRLYDTAAGETITLSEVTQYVEQDIRFKVVDNATGEDVTVAVLAQVLGERIKSWDQWPQTIGLLRLLIRKGGERSVSVLDKTVLAAIGLIAITAENAEKLVDELIKRGELDKSKRATAIREAVEKAQKSATEAAGKIKDTVVDTVKQGSPTKKFARATDLDDLSAKVDKLTEMMERVEQRLGQG